MSSDQQILFVNNLLYKNPVPQSVVVDRVLKRQYFQNTRYNAGQTMICILNTGSDFVDTDNSSLILKVKVTGTGGFWAGSFGTGSGLNLARNVRLYHRTGVCYSNTQRINLYHKLKDRYTMQQEWMDTVGRLMGYDQGADTITNIAEGADELTVVLPLKHFHSFFAPESKVYLPACMASGLRVEIDLASFAEAFVNDPTQPGTINGYSIEECYIETMNVQLQDSSQSAINEMASSQSLEYVYKDIFTSQNTSPALSTAVNIDINKAVSFADSVVATVQDSAKLNDITQDSFDCDFRRSEWWISLGSNYYPSAVKVSDERVAYKNALMAFDKLKHSEKPSLTTLQDFNTTNGVYAVSLERDTALALSQTPVNSSRALRFETTFTTPPAEEITLTLFMTYLVSARSTLTSSRIDI